MVTEDQKHLMIFRCNILNLNLLFTSMSDCDNVVFVIWMHSFQNFNVKARASMYYKINTYIKSHKGYQLFMLVNKIFAFCYALYVGNSYLPITLLSYFASDDDPWTLILVFLSTTLCRYITFDDWKPIKRELKNK